MRSEIRSPSGNRGERTFRCELNQKLHHRGLDSQANNKRGPGPKFGIGRTDSERLRRARAYRRQNRGRINKWLRDYRTAHLEEARAKEKEYQERDKEGYNRRQRERHQARIAKLSKKELALFRKDSHREERLGITQYVGCRKCGGKLKTLIGGPKSHLLAAHGITKEVYHEKWPGAPLVCAALRNEQSRKAKKQMGAARGRVRVAVVKSVRGHRGEVPAKKRPILCLLVQGGSCAKIGRQLKRQFTTIEAAAHSMGFRGRPGVYEFGEPFGM